MIVLHNTPIALSTQEIEEDSKTNSELEVVQKGLDSGDGSTCKYSSFVHVKEELCSTGSLVLRGTHLIIPKSQGVQILKLAHEDHQGIVKTKLRLRSKVWWPKMDAEVEDYCKRCQGCQVVSEHRPPKLMARIILPNGPWQNCAADLMGPLPNDESILVIVDYLSRYYKVAILGSTTTERIIESLTPIFSRLGSPVNTSKTDNAPRFISTEFKAFLKEYGVEHRTSIPLWPQSNGEVERQHRTLLKAIKISQWQWTNTRKWKLELSKFLMAYRSTPHVSAGVSPYFLMDER